VISGTQKTKDHFFGQLEQGNNISQWGPRQGGCAERLLEKVVSHLELDGAKTLCIEPQLKFKSPASSVVCTLLSVLRRSRHQYSERWLLP
jgi:hypothetical protein